jgi:hypothetical protein
MSIVVGIVLVMAGACIGVGIMAMFALKGRDDRAEEVADALRRIDMRMDWLAFDVEGDGNLSDSVGMCRAAVLNLVDLLGYSRSVLGPCVEPAISTSNDADTHCHADGGSEHNGMKVVSITNPASGLKIYQHEK